MDLCSGAGHHRGGTKKLTEAVDWFYSKKKKGYCDTCRAAARQRKKAPACGTCSNAPPLIFGNNVPVYNCLLFCSHQLRAGFSGAYALDWNVVARVADDMGIVTDEMFWAQIAACERIIISNITRR